MQKARENRRPDLPNARTVRRACNRELLRAVKKMKIWVPPEAFAEAEKLYFAKLVSNLAWVAENGDNRKKLADWWEREVAPDIAALWKVDAGKLSKAFRDAFGG